MRHIFIFLICSGLPFAQTKDVSPRQLTSVTFANLGTPPDGTILYCSDCAVANPCAGSGSGAVARHEAGAWNCSAGSVAPAGSGVVVVNSGTFGTPISPGAAGHVVRSTGSAYADSAIQVGDVPTLNQNTTGSAATAANLTGTPTLPNGTAATTQTTGDSTTKLATDAFVATGLATKAASNASLSINGQTMALGGSYSLYTGVETVKWVFGATAPVQSGAATQTDPPTHSANIAGCFAHADVAPTGQDMILDVQVGGTSIFGTNPLVHIPAGQNDSSIVTLFSNPSIGPTNPPYAVATQVGSTVAGQNVTLVCYFQGAGYEVLKWTYGANGTVTVGDAGQNNPPSQPTSLAGCFAHADTAPVGGPLTVDIKVGGTTQATVTISDGANDSSLVTSFSNPAIAPTSPPSTIVTGVGSTTAGAGVTVVCYTPATTPPAGASSLGGVLAKTCTGTDKFSGLSTSGVFTCSTDQSGGGGGGSGLSVLIDNGADGTHYGASPAGCTTLNSTNDGQTWLFRAAHSSTGTATFNWCGTGAATFQLQGGSLINVNDIIQYNSGSTPFTYLITYISATNSFYLIQNLRMSNDSEAASGNGVGGVAVDMPQVVSGIKRFAPLGPVGVNKHQVAKYDGLIWNSSDPPGRPGSGRTYLEWYADGGTTLQQMRMTAAVTSSGTACGTIAATAIGSTAPRMVGFPTDGTTAGHYCIVHTSAGVTWAGNGEPVFDATIELSAITGSSWFIGVVDESQMTNPAVMSYNGSGFYPGGLVGFRFDPVSGANDSVTWRAVVARDGSSAPNVCDTGGTFGTLTTNVVHMQFRWIESTGEFHVFIGPAGGANLNEVCTSGWSPSSPGGHFPNAVALGPYLGVYNVSPGSAPTLYIADVGLEVASVPGQTP